MSKIKILSNKTINRIAAGEVIARPASAIKELVENSIDAGSSEIEIVISQGGRNLIIISDDGEGIEKEELLLALTRHATSKLNEEDITDINHFGFRGEALPSIASISKFKIESKKRGCGEAYSLTAIGGDLGEIAPSNCLRGTRIEVRDIFFATPARLKFLKSIATETKHIQEIIDQIALANPSVSVKLISENKELINYKAHHNSDASLLRVSEVMGKDFINNSSAIDLSQHGIEVKGFISIPTLNLSYGDKQFFFVNKRPIKDKALANAVKVAYQDYITSGRYPYVCIFISLPNYEVDVNVHPAKLEVRFKDQSLVRQLVYNAITRGLEDLSHKTSTTLSDSMIAKFQMSAKSDEAKLLPRISERNYEFQMPSLAYSRSFSATKERSLPILEKSIVAEIPKIVQQVGEEKKERTYVLGTPLCQIFSNYIISQSDSDFYLIDQHAAHERIVYERMKQDFFGSRRKSQLLLLPETLVLESHLLAAFLRYKSDLEKLGFGFLYSGGNSMNINEVPTILGDVEVKELIEKIIHELAEDEKQNSFDEAIEHILETIACHNSVRSGRRLSIFEMEELIREIETTPFSGQCNHGRPTYISLRLKDLEILFGRS